MGKVNGTSCTFTVFFEDPFWVGVFERVEGDWLSVAKVTFGAEPKDCELVEFVLNHYAHLQFCEPVLIGDEAEGQSYADAISGKSKVNPKRMQRDVKKQMGLKGVGTKSQQALQQQHEQGKLERKTKSREQKQEAADRAFELRQQKKKQKHRGH